MKTSEVLERALEKLGPNGEHWTQGTSYRDAKGADVWDDEEGTVPSKAVCCCASAAVVSAENEGHRHYKKSPAYKLLAWVIKQHVPDWNDAEGRTFPEVSAAFLKAIGIARKQEQAHDN